MEQVIKFSPSEFINVVNQTLEYAYESVLIEGEVASFKTSQGKWVFFDLKDEESSISCFMALWDLRMPIEDGMKIIVRGVPKITKWGKFSFTVQSIKPVGEGNLKKAYELLKKKLNNEGLFLPEKKRTLPEDLEKIGVISSMQAAGYADFIKIINARWGGLKIQVAHTQVQGMDAPDQIIKALDFFNEKGNVQVIAILRGGGSMDDLAAFNDEKLVRAIAASKIPVITGIGHEIDESLADLAADVRASTPSNAAEILTKDRKAEQKRICSLVDGLQRYLLDSIKVTRENNIGNVKKVANVVLTKYIEPIKETCKTKVDQVLQKIQLEYDDYRKSVDQKMKLLAILNPEKVLSQGYAIISGKISPGELISIMTFKREIKAEVKEVYERKNES